MMTSAMPPPLIVLTTDFGADSPAVGVMKGVILNINPAAMVVDFTHSVGPQNVLQGAFVLGNGHRFFPDHAIHVAVVDPGVGTSRHGLLLTTPHGRFVAPDNGLLSNVIRDYMPHPPEESGRVSIPPDCSARILNQPEYWLHPVSNTFHGRDVFSPVAAHLSLGAPDENMGPLAQQMEYLASPQPSVRKTGEGQVIQGEVTHIDHFGNLMTNITASILATGTVGEVRIKDRHISSLSKTFHDDGPAPEGSLVALISSSGYLEIAIRDGNAAEYLSAAVGVTVTVYTGAP